MKVLIFMTQFYRLSGAERLAVELAEELNKRGIHSDILSMYTENMSGVLEAKEALLRKGIPAVHFLGMKIHPPITSMFPAILKLRRMIRDEGYDIVETSMISPTVIASWATQGTRARHVAGLHHVYRRELHNSLQQMFWRFSVRCNKRIRFYAISDYVTDCWVEYSRTSPLYTRRIYNAIPDDSFDVVPDRYEVRKDLGIPGNARLAIYVGRLVAYKGIDTLLNALSPILEKENLFLLYVGQPYLGASGTQEMLQQIERQVAEASWRDRVKFLGYRKDVPRLMASSDILVHPTRTEGFGLILAEAMATGLPVVASNVEGIPEVLAGTDSVMVPPDDPEVLRKAVLKILNRRPEEAARAIKKGQIRAEDFRIEKRTDAMVKLFEDIRMGWL
ncbi:glycosyltransferase [Desulfoprunum benzoelyticum]|uniref:Glycosyltransferase involved in cell wall biosynthesis n=1 Tax=Desulfoprunum benzoelyticum TaxID=1506996 RepID=A0A840UR03_9BACT|nr:glycosyltransferase [Desulfoprunum benzoelyticum]MBB5348075.1 glycosyltransferase involved in cell wall biosynthesis [Desulfoprunum benzoelyticum]MBM9531589.1 glycosyltransferase [Desulfoprunum benzoelyticum]